MDPEAPDPKEDDLTGFVTALPGCFFIVAVGLVIVHFIAKCW